MTLFCVITCPSNPFALSFTTSQHHRPQSSFNGIHPCTRCLFPTRPLGRGWRTCFASHFFQHRKNSNSSIRIIMLTRTQRRNAVLSPRLGTRFRGSCGTNLERFYLMLRFQIRTLPDSPPALRKRGVHLVSVFEPCR